ncbi:MAG: glycogen/starch synthase [Candidatus Lokiarchaeota archaeon]|nr:glycogen/starch synthase [Candidatus Lokiarchaeota archaeon]
MLGLETETNSPTVVFVSYENHYAPWGGLAAVMKMLPPIMSKSVRTILVSPLFFNIAKTKQAIESKLLISTGKKGKVLYKGFFHKIELFRSTEFKDYENFDIFLVKCDNFFLSGDNPYHDSWRPDSLIHDSYFLSKSIPVVLKLVEKEYPAPYVLNLQDWETALVADIVPSINGTKSVLTLHNPYDEYLPNDPQGRTILQFAIPKMQGISTVSEQFSRELQYDVLVHGVLVQKIREQLQILPPIGINNGNFVKLTFPENLKCVDEVLNEKRRNREIFHKILTEREDIKPKWGNQLNLLWDDIPIFFLFGRDEPKQKGFDVAAAAIYRLLRRLGPDSAFFVLTPIPSPRGLAGLSYLEDLCLEFAENVMTFPYRISSGYENLQRAASFVVMPSYYEPFGAANEGYASGAPVIARATGGLIQQVCPANFDDLPSRVQIEISRYHEDLSKPTGFLYREHPNTETTGNWEYLLSTDFSKRKSALEPVHWKNPVFWSMVSELENVIEKAILCYKQEKKAYCNMILNGIQLFKRFSWEKSARDYRELLYKIE